MKKHTTTTFMMKAVAACAIALPLLLSSCSKNDDVNNNDGNEILAPSVGVTALLQGNRITSFNAQTSVALTQTLSITGLQTGETMLAIDYRPATGELYGVSSGSRVYVINPANGAARAVNSTPFTPAIDGTAIGIDFNPTADLLRLVSNNGQNLRINPVTGTVAGTDGAINGATGAKISSVAYTENYAGATSTILYDIDPVNKKLYKQETPNSGTLVEVGGLGVDATAVSDFDITPDSKSALATITVGGIQGLYGIDLANGRAYKAYTVNVNVLSVAIFTNPVAYAVSTNNELLTFNPANPATPVTKTISGLQANEQIVGIDFRPVNGQLYGLGNTSRLYTINITSGAATQVGTVAFEVPLSGTLFGFDVDPVSDMIRVVSNTGQNLRINPTSGNIAGIDTPLPANQFVNAAAYTNSFAGATSTVLYTINTQTGKLYKQDPNAGTMTEVGPLGITITEANGFDIGSASNAAYGLFTVGNVTRLYGINLTNGAAVAGGTLPQGVRGFALGLGF